MSFPSNLSPLFHSKTSECKAYMKSIHMSMNQIFQVNKTRMHFAAIFVNYKDYADLCHARVILHKRKSNTEYNSLPQSILGVVVK